MESKEYFSDVAKGALLGAHFRRYMDSTYEKIAEMTSAGETARTFFDSDEDMHRATAWLPLFYEVRARGLTRHLKKLVGKMEHKNVLEVGAGVDVSRAIEVSKNPEVNYVISDHSSLLVDMQREMVNGLVPRERTNLKIIKLDALNEEQTLEAVEQFKGKGHVKVSDGLLSIFTGEERDRYLEIARKTKATILTNDIFTRERLEFLVSKRPEALKLLARLHGVKGSSAVMIDEALNAYDSLYSYLGKQGFKVQRVLLYDGLGYELTSPYALKKKEGIVVDTRDIENAVRRSAWILTPRE